MARLVKTLLIWLLVLVVPAQGAAAATMAFCGPDHHGDGAARAAVHATVSAHAHHADVLPGPAVHAPNAGMSADMAVADDAPAAAEASHGANQKCSACVSCCSLGAMLSPVPVVPAADPAPTVFTARVPTVDAFATDGPDRPPRHVLV